MEQVQESLRTIVKETSVKQLGKCIIVLVGVLLTSLTAPAQNGNPKEEEALLKKAEAFVTAFNKGDAKALAAHWTPDGIYRDQKGKETKGREAIEKMFKDFFAENKGLKLRINVSAMRFTTKDVVVEEGTTEVIQQDGSPPSVAHYVILHVKKDGEWYMDIVKESVFTPPTNYKHLNDLEFLIGDWEDDVEKGDVGRLSFSWGPNQNYIIGSYATTFKNITLHSGTQWIAWDPATKKIRSWSFDNSGGFGEGSWTKDGKKWMIKTAATLPDGKKATATNTVTVLDANTITIQFTDRTIDGKDLKDTKEIKMKRVK
jgi:uncharacterized protein (TIGR02246 family)